MNNFNGSNENPWESFKRIPSTVSSLFDGIGQLIKEDKFFNGDEWSKTWNKATTAAPAEGAATAEAPGAEGTKEKAVPAEGEKKAPKEDGFLSAIQGLFSGSNEEVIILGNQTDTTTSKATRTDSDVSDKEHLQKRLAPETGHQPLEPSLTQPAQTPLQQLRQVFGLGLEREQEPAVILTAPAQSEQERIKQLLIKKIEERAPEPAASPAPLESTAPTQEEIFANRVKNLTAIFLELKYKKIDEILNESTSAQDKIQEIKKFQKQFTITFPIDVENLDNVLDRLSLEIEKTGLDVQQVDLSSTKYTPDSYNQTELQDYSIDSRHYLDGILQNDTIDAEKRITAAKRFVAHLELVGSSPNLELAKKHKEFVKFHAQQASDGSSKTDNNKIVQRGTEFAKSEQTPSISFLDDKGEVSNPSYFYDSVVKPEVAQREYVVSKFKERLFEMSLLLESTSLIDKTTTDKIFKKTSIDYEIDLSTNEITFKDPAAAPAAADAAAPTAAPAASAAPAVAAAAGAAKVADPAVADATSAKKDAIASHPITANISFNGLSDEDILRLSLYFRFVCDGIMEGNGNDEDREKAIKSLIEEMKITTETRFANQNSSYKNHIHKFTSDQNGRVIISTSNTAEIKALKAIGTKLLRNVEVSKDQTFFMSDPAMQKIYQDTKLNLKTPSIDDTSMKTKTKMGNEDTRKYIKAVQQFQREKIKEILAQSTGSDSEKIKKIQAILKLSLTYNTDNSSELKIKTTKENLEKIKKLAKVINDTNTFDREKSLLMQSYFSGLYEGALTTAGVSDEKKILGIKAIAEYEWAADFDPSSIDSKKLKDNNTNANANAIASGQAITRAIKQHNFDEKGEMKDFKWQDEDGIINQKKLAEVYKKSLEKEEEKKKATKSIVSSLLSPVFYCFRPGKTKELTEEGEEKETELTQDQKEKKSKLLNLHTKIEYDANSNKYTEPTLNKKNNILYRTTKAKMDDILSSDETPDKIKLLTALMDLRTDSVNNFSDDFSKNPDLKIPNQNQYNAAPGIRTKNSFNYLQKFCKAILDSKNENGIDDKKKLIALQSFLDEQNNKSLQPINKETADGNPTDDKIKTKAQEFLNAVSKAAREKVVYSDVRIFDKMKELKSTAAAVVIASTPAPAAAAAAAAAADVAEEANKTLEREKSKKSSEGAVSSEGSPNSSPRAPKPPLSAAKNRPQDFYEGQIANAERMKMERASPNPSSPER
jgi:hypothetical protein